MTADVQIGAKHHTMRPRELTGQERQTVWTDVILAEDPRIGRFATKAGRTIPVAVLEPTEPWSRTTCPRGWRTGSTRELVPNPPRELVPARS
ncbi:DUF385 domain-containing protein [Kribbella turkmenica]|uniref:DUF385 domain-containing protein n=1 Tax=Kribbella turkmenica TaxID=2530375 RepID=A0A4R4WG14_9ACTN|nr:nitroreductase/quinone reductase family protein [Kribbella turkmenica]TDD15174.1 DUF385 domain-containing protein [Kribbella turkmenica]